MPSSDIPKLAEITVETTFCKEMDALRLLAFPDEKIDTSLDEFDNKSYHIVIRTGNTIVAYGRLTPGPDSVFEAWTLGKAEIPTGENVIDLGRCLVNPKYKGLNFIEPLFASALIYADKMNYEFVVGAFRVGRKLISAGHKLGFVESGLPVDAYTSHDNTVLIQPMVCELTRKRELWDKIINSNQESLIHHGYLLKLSI